MPVPESFFSTLKEIVGPEGWTDDARALEPMLSERRGLERGTCDLAVFPASTGEVARLVATCFEAGVAVTPQGGNTGLVGGGVPEGGIVLSLRRMNRIRDLDSVNFTLTAEAGCILADVQATAEAENRLFPLSLAAEGSCQIGGNLSTNAGGTGVLRYGNARDLVLGLEVVLPDGRVWDGLRGLRKDNTGYDLKQLFIGAEGTLGVITAAVLKLYPGPGGRATALAALASADAAMTLFERLRAGADDALTGFEVMNRTALAMACDHVPGLTDPFATPHPCYALIELTGADDATGGGDNGVGAILEAVLAPALEDGTVMDAVIAQSGSQADGLWKIRESIPDAQSAAGASLKHDISVPVSQVARFLARAEPLVADATPGARIVAFGHVGDGNVHFNLSRPGDMSDKAFLALRDAVGGRVFDLADELGGSFSAEHGIGTFKKDALAHYRSAVELDLMRSLKTAIDPKNIMNPGKVI